MRDEKKERSKQGQTNKQGKATQHTCTCTCMEERTFLAVQMTTLQGEVEALLERRLAEVANQTAESSDATKALMMEAMSSRIELHLETAKQQWMALVSATVCMGGGLCDSLYEETTAI